MQIRPEQFNSDLFQHVRIVIAVLLGLTIGKLLQGMVSFVEHPTRQRISWVHFGWAVWALISVVGFWWWEFRLSYLTIWTFGSYLFVLTFASSYFVLSASLFPADLDEYSGFEEYFMVRRRWIFGVIATIYLLDIGDGFVKGRQFVEHLGWPYIIRTITALFLCIVAMNVRNSIFHKILVVVAIIGQVSILFVYYNQLN